jgi:benzoate/toluate 1,2-dioxygenase reductase subunit
VAPLAREARHRVRLLARRWLTPDILELRLSRPDGFAFLPGQFLRFWMEGVTRDYTLVSAPDDATMDFCIAMVWGGRFSRALREAAVGDAFSVSGPYGHFIFQGGANPPVFVATGTGVAPFVAFCRSGVTGARLLHGVREPAGLIYRDLLQVRLAGYVACISGPGEASTAGGAFFPGRVTGYLASKLAPGNYDFYVSGRRGMIGDVTALIDTRFPDSRLFVEPYD